MVYYVSLPFIRVEGGLAPGEAVECPHGAAAIRRAQAMALDERNAGAIAFSRSGDRNLGEFEDTSLFSACNPAAVRNKRATTKDRRSGITASRSPVGYGPG
jgi:hypothetical protein